jgi:hypothetical protein
MKNQPHPRRIDVAFAILLCFSIGCMACLAGLSFYTMQKVLQSQTSHSQSFVPAKRLAAAFERDILNARIHFIYFVTIQKTGTLDLGWGRYHKAESDLADLTALVNRQAELEPLRAPVAKLRADLDSYGPALAATLQMVQGGELKGAHYDAQVKEWAARGAVMVADAGNVQNLTATTSEASTDRMVNSVKSAEMWISLAFAAGFLLCLVVGWTLAGKIKRELHSIHEERRANSAEADRRVKGLSASRI